MARGRDDIAAIVRSSSTLYTGNRGDSMECDYKEMHRMYYLITMIPSPLAQSRHTYTVCLCHPYAFLQHSLPTEDVKASALLPWDPMN